LVIVGMRGPVYQTRFQCTEKWGEVCIMKCFDGGKVRNGECQHRDAV
jgi:hypothetical protein